MIETKITAKIVKIIAVIVGCPILGALLGIVVFWLVYRGDAWDMPSGPGGFLLLIYMAPGVIISLVAAQVLIIRIIESPLKTGDSN